MPGTYRRIAASILFLVTLAAAAPLWAQATPEMPVQDLPSGEGPMGDPLGGGLGNDFPGLGGGLDGGLGGLGGAPLSVSAVFTAATADRPAELYITAEIRPGWHIYSITQAKGGPEATTISVPPTTAFRVSGNFEAVPGPKKKMEAVWNNLVVETHEGRVVWHAPIELAAGVDPSTLTIQGTVTVQPCTDTACQPSTDYPFSARLGQPPIALTAAASKTTGQTLWGDVTPSELWTNLGWALLGGLILNLMPCVLPVISFKIFSFVEQAGESRGRIFLLNVWFSLGLMAVFLILAAMAVAAGLSWGEQFTLPWFKVALTALVFVMALSFLGVWEIPIPGFVGRGRVGQLQAKEGYAGAFLKGMFTTVLATPCSGPLLGPIFGFLLNKPPLMTYLVFAALGLGMALPYLLIGLFPRLIAFLPKPGAWMETLRQVLAFLLLGAMVYLFSTLTAAYFIPTLTLIVGLWFCFWWIGRTPLTASDAQQWTARLGGLGTAALIGVFAFTFLLSEPLLPWQPFSPGALKAARGEGKTVMIDFTAKWCLTCQTNSVVAIEREEVLELVKRNGVVPLLADWTDRSPMLKDALNELGYNSIPLLVIWPADADKPIVLPDLVTKDDVLAALEKAGPSRGVKPSAVPLEVR